MPDSLHVLAIDPFHGGSHREFLRSVAELSRHRWTLVTGKPVHWKWRMRSAPLELAAAARSVIDAKGYPDVVFCSDMLDVAQWRGLVRDPRIVQTPTVIYFHESQWNYPLAPEARIDHHFGYTNLVSALAADACWFNSEFHLREFLDASAAFVARMPDSNTVHDFDALRRRCRFVPPGFDAARCQVDDRPDADPGRPMTLGWVSRWEHDKRPDRLLGLLRRIENAGVDFRLVLLGPRPRTVPDALAEIRQRCGGAILHDGFAESIEAYRSWLRAIDVVVSTADHEYFGIGVCEAVWAGAAPLVPDRLSYPELSPPECRYDSIEDAAGKLQSWIDPEVRQAIATAAREKIAPLRRELIVPMIDQRLAELV